MSTKTLRTLNLRSWSGFEVAIQKLENERQVKSARRLTAPLFRGHGSNRWKLETTLERSYPFESSQQQTSFLEYYRALATAKPVIETLSGKERGIILDYPTFGRKLKAHGISWLDMFMIKYPTVWEYFVYVRHHGFPSPLLDWTTSPYVAAFFAFDSPPRNAKRVCVYAMTHDTIHGVSSDAHLMVVGPYMRSHPRHFQQQCRYTLCVGIDLKNQDYVFRPHQLGMQQGLGQNGRLTAITIPLSERTKALRHLERMNINAFSLFGTEDSLIRTIARRELLLRE